MRLARIKVANHRRLNDVDIQLRDHVVLIGPNDVGKTSLLRIVNLILGSTAQLYQNLSAIDIRDTGSPLTAAAVFVEFCDSERALFPREIDVDPHSRQETLEVQLEVRVDPEDDESVLISRWCPGRGEVRSPTREQIAGFGWRYLPALRPGSAAHFDSASGTIQTLLRAVEPNLGDEKAALGTLLASFNDKLQSSHALTELRKGMSAHLSNSMPQTVAADDLALRTTTDPSESVLDNVSMYVKRDTDYVPLSQQSDGIRQLIAMTLFDLAEGSANVVAIDEPELHLHPSSQRTAAELLAGSANQKILVTHSPHVIQRFDPSQVVTMRADGSCRQIGPAPVSLEERTHALWWSPRMLEALTARVAILVEGVSDRLIVEAAAKSLGISLDRLGAVVIELGGAENFKNVYKLLGPNGFDVDVLGLVDDAEKAPWIGVVGGKPTTVVGTSIFVSVSDLEEEYSVAIGAQELAGRLVTAKVAHDENALLSSCGASSANDLTAAQVAQFCRSNAGSGKGSRKIPAAIAVSKTLTLNETQKIASVYALLNQVLAQVDK